MDDYDPQREAETTMKLAKAWRELARVRGRRSRKAHRPGGLAAIRRALGATIADRVQHIPNCHNCPSALKQAWKSVDKVTSKAFVGMWRARVDELYMKYMATAAGGANQ